MLTLKEVLQSRDGLDPDEAQFEIDDMRQRMLEGEDPEEILHEYGLEPDYTLDLFI